MLELKDISYKVNENGKEKYILKNINFCCKNLDMIAITGHNGSGKSTLLKIIMGIITPTTGKVIFNKKDITNMTVDERAKLGISYSFQQPVLFKGLTIQKLLEISHGKEEKIDYYCEILSKLGLCAREYLNREISAKLSGGEQKRVEIASVLVRNSKLNLFDEPEAGIDIWSFDNLLNVFKLTKCPNIIVSHQRKLIEQANKILVLQNGEIAMFGDSEEILPKLSQFQVCNKLRGDYGQD